MSAEAVINRFHALTLSADGDGYILGGRDTSDFVAIPQIGGLVVQWLQDGHSLDECARRAGEHAGEKVDVAGFLAQLESAGLLPSPGGAVTAASDRPPRGSWLGRALFGRVGVTILTTTAAAGLLILLTRPALRPVYSDALVTSVPLVSMLIMTAFGTAFALTHELAHLLAAAARGVPASISMGRRLWNLVWQTDLSRMWLIPRWQRLVPLAAGMLVDSAVMGGLLILLAGPLQETDPLLKELARAAVFNRFGSLVFQFQFFMRTDVYAAFVVLTGCRNLWATKGAVARRLIRRATPEDLAHLAAVGRREVRWGAIYLLLYVPGVVWATWYYIRISIPALWLILRTSVIAIDEHGLLSALGAAGAVALLLRAVPMILMLLGVLRSAARVLRATFTRGLTSRRRNS